MAIDNPFKGEQLPKRYPSSGLQVLIVGGGIAGLTFAIEAYRKGHDVRIIDRRPNFDDYGDMIAIQDSATRTFKSWPGFMERALDNGMSAAAKVRKHDGTLVGEMEPFGLSTTRSHIHMLIYDYANYLGIPIRFSARVAEYFEEASEAGVVLEDGEKMTGDVVVAADGIGSPSWQLVSGFKEKPISSGYAIYRSKYPIERAMACPEVAKMIKSGRCQSELIFGSGAHLVCGSTATHVMWLLTHKDNGSANEDWNATVDRSAALPYVEGWEPWVVEMINATPPDSTIDWKLMWRNPRENWCSPEARMIQIGDAAHTFLPTSAAGATMAIEDAMTLATTLQLGGRSNAPLAVKVHNKLRFERVACAQKMGFKNRESLHENNKGSRAVGRDLLSPKWLTHHDPEQYAYDMYGKCVNHIISGASFQNTNSVPGHTFKMWTVQEMIEKSERHEAVLDDGEWA